jgi:hypothetical protein
METIISLLDQKEELFQCKKVIFLEIKKTIALLISYFQEKIGFLIKYAVFLFYLFKKSFFRKNSKTIVFLFCVFLEKLDFLSISENLPNE